jgi:hypothetical protein
MREASVRGASFGIPRVISSYILFSINKKVFHLILHPLIYVRTVCMWVMIKARRVYLFLDPGPGPGPGC